MNNQPANEALDGQWSDITAGWYDFSWQPVAPPSDISKEQFSGFNVEVIDAGIRVRAWVIGIPNGHVLLGKRLRLLRENGNPMP